MMQQLAASSTELATSSKQVSHSQDTDKPASEFVAMFEQHQQKKSNPSNTGAHTSSSEHKHTNQTKGNQEKTHPDSAEQSDSQTKAEDATQVETTATTANKPASKTGDETTVADEKTDDVVSATDDELKLANDTEKESEQLHTTWLDLLDKIKAVTQGSDKSQPKESEEESSSVLSQLFEKLFSSESDEQADKEKFDHAIDQLADSTDQQEQPTDLDALLAMINEQDVAGEQTDPLNESSDNTDIINILAELIKSLQLNGSNEDQSLQSGTDQLDKDNSIDQIMAQLTATTDGQSGEQQASQLFDSVDRVLAFLTAQQHEGSQLSAKQQLPEVKQDIAKLADDMKNILSLPKEQLNKMLDKLTTQMLPDTPTETKQTFIASLQAGINEIRNQLEQGREPGLDLQAMVGKAMAELTKTNPDSAGALSRQSVAQVLDFARMADNNAQPMVSNQAGEHIVDDSAVRLGEAGKVLQHNNGVDKNSANLQKMEGIKTLVDKVQLMVNQKNLVADIRIDPPDLGSMQIRLHLGGDQASVSFVVQNQQARDMLEQSTPRLKEMLAEKGIELGQSSVRQEKDQANDGADQQGSAKGGQFAQDDSNSESPEQQTTHEMHVTNGALGGIDYFV